MKEVKRYNIAAGEDYLPIIYKHEFGNYVKFIDHRSTIQELKDRIKELEAENSDLRGTVQTRDEEFEKLTDQLNGRVSEWQICPKCNGEGRMPGFGTSVFDQCDVCNGSKTLVKPIIPINQKQ